MFSPVSTRIAVCVLLLAAWATRAGSAAAPADTLVIDDVFPAVLLAREQGVPQQVAEDCLAALREAGADLRRSLWPYALDPPRIHVRLLTGPGFARARDELGGAPDWGVGLSAGWLVLIDCDRAGGGGRTVPTILLHELAHSLIHYAAGGGSGVPRWFHEGVAQTASGEWRLVDNVSLILGGRVPSPLDLQGPFPAAAAWADQAYRASLLAVTWLEKWHGPDAVPRILTATRLAGDFEAGFLAVTGTTVAQFSARFAGTTGRRYGWIIGLTRWPGLVVPMALAFAAGAALRIARTRRRLAAMPDHDEAGYGDPPGDDLRPM